MEADIFCVWNRKPWSAQSVHTFLERFSSLQPDSDQKIIGLSSKPVLGENPRDKYLFLYLALPDYNTIFIHEYIKKY